MSAPATAASVLRFEIFELDLRAGELRKNGVKLRLQGQPLQVLATLLKHAGDLVTREELRAQIWPADTFVDFDHSLHNAIARLREVLGDSAETPRYIETLPRRGYRFIAQVEGVSKHEPERSLEPTAIEAPAPVRIKPRAALGVALLTIIFIGIAFWLLPAVSHRTRGVPPIRSIAVLPLANLSGDPSQDYLADAMTDELITDLAKLRTLRVTSRTTIALYKHTNKKLPEIARELNVDGIVEGSVVRVGQRVRVTAQLIGGSADQHLWAETYERDFGDALRLQDDVTEAIAQHVRAELTSEQQALFRSQRPVDPQAYDAYLKGSYYLYNSQITMPGPVTVAKSYFEEAVRRDANFSGAYSGLANSYFYLIFYGQGQIPPAEGYKRAREAAQKALQLDPNNAEAYDVLGQLSWHADFDWNAADRAFSRSLALAPSYSCALEDRAQFLAFMGRSSEALAEAEKTRQIDPPATWLEREVYLQLRDWTHVVETGLREAASNPEEWTAHASLGAGFEGIGKMPEAIAEYHKAVELSNGNFNAMASLGHAYAVIGKKTEAEKVLHDLEERSMKRQASPYLAATIYAGLGNKDKAFELIEQAYHEKSLEFVWALKSDVRADNLRSDPRFQDLLRRTGLN